MLMLKSHSFLSCGHWKQSFLDKKHEIALPSIAVKHEIFKGRLFLTQHAAKVSAISSTVQNFFSSQVFHTFLNLSFPKVNGNKRFLAFFIFLLKICSNKETWNRP